MSGGGRVALGVFSSFVCIFLVLPTLAVAPLSFTETDFIIYPPTGFSLKWYDAFFSTRAWTGSLRTSLLVGVLATFLATPLGTFAAVALLSLPPRLRSVCGSVFLLPIVVPSIILAVALYRTLAPLGLAGTIPGLVLAHTLLALPFVVINVSAVAQRVDWRIYNAARSLGATPARAFIYVVEPALRPGILAGAVFAFLTSFDEAVVALFLSGVGATTLPVQMWSGIRFEISPIVAAVSTMLLAFSCALLLVYTLVKKG